MRRKTKISINSLNGKERQALLAITAFVKAINAFHRAAAFAATFDFRVFL